MTQKELVEKFRDECSTLAALVAGKNATYAGQNGNGAFQNFDLIAQITNGHINREAGCFVRMTDKMSRLWSLLDGNPDQVGESFGDTAIDLAGYAILLKLMYEESATKRLEAYRAAPVEPPQFTPEETAQKAPTQSAWEKLTAGLRA